MKESIQLSELQNYLAYSLKCRYTGIINGKELSQQDRQYKKDGLPFDFTIQPETGLKTGILKEILVFKNYWKCCMGSHGRALKSFTNGCDFKPLVRPLSECREYLNNENGIEIDFSMLSYNSRLKSINVYTDGSESTHSKDVYNNIYVWLFKNHFDVFNWIGRGLAISLTDFEKEKTL